MTTQKTLEAVPSVTLVPPAKPKLHRFPEPIAAIMGQPGSGKTFQAGMLIPEFRAAVLAKKPHAPTLRVSDVDWLQFDRAGSDTLRAYGVEPVIHDVSTPPTSKIDLFSADAAATTLAKLVADRLAWLRWVNAAVVAIKERSARGETRLLVVDSMTAFTRMVTDSYLFEEPLSNKFDRYAAYRMANLAIGQIVNGLRGVQCPQIWLLHSRTAYTTDTAERMDDSARRAQKHTVEIDVQRGVQGSIEPIPSLVLGAKLTSDDTGNVSYQLVVRPDGMFPIKNRWAIRMPTGPMSDLQLVWDSIIAAAAE